MCLSTLFCANDGGSFLNLRFENDVKTYGTETIVGLLTSRIGFENDVKTYGTETIARNKKRLVLFENDVKTYGAETHDTRKPRREGLRMM